MDTPITGRALPGLRDPTGSTVGPSAVVIVPVPLIHGLQWLKNSFRSTTRFNNFAERQAPTTPPTTPGAARPNHAVPCIPQTPLGAPRGRAYLRSRNHTQARTMRHTHDRSHKHHNAAFSAELAMDLPIGPRQVSQLSSTYLLLGWFGRAPLLAHIERADEFSQDVQLGAASHLRIVEQDLGFGKLAGL